MKKPHWRSGPVWPVLRICHRKLGKRAGPLSKGRHLGISRWLPSDLSILTGIESYSEQYNRGTNCRRQDFRVGRNLRGCSVKPFPFIDEEVKLREAV